MDSDLFLIIKMKQGNETACEQFIRKYYGDILKYCHFHCQDQAFAEDLTQEVFLKFFISLPQYQHIGKAKNYLYTIAANLCKNARMKKKELPLDQAAGIYMDPFPETDHRLLLEIAIGHLPEEMQSVVVLHYNQGLKLSEVADVLKISLPLVKYRLKRAKERLRKELDHGSE